MTEKKEKAVSKDKRQYVITMICTLLAIELIVGSTFLSFYIIARKDAVAIGESSVSEQSERLNNFLLKSLDILDVTGTNVEYMMRNGACGQEIVQYLACQTEDYAQKVDKDFTGIYGLFHGEFLDGTDSYAANITPYAVDKCSLDTDVSPIIVSATENYLATALAGRLAEYGAEAAVECFGWYDATNTMWFYWEKFLSDAMLENGGLNLYPAYTLQVPAQLEGAKPDEISCVPVLITVEETGEFFCLNLPEGAKLTCVSQNGNVLKWKQNGTETDEISVGRSMISLFSLSVTK